MSTMLESAACYAGVGMDPMTWSAVIHIQLEDARELVLRSKDKQREGTESDAQIALRLFASELEACQEALRDSEMARSVALAVQRDAEAIACELRCEMQARSDRELALKMSGGQERGSECSVEAVEGFEEEKDGKNTSMGEEMLAQIAAQSVGDQLESASVPEEEEEQEEEEAGQAESSKWAASRASRSRMKQRKCVVCGEEKGVEEAARVPCGHEYCSACLTDLFTLSMKDETLFPPRCDHQEIPLDLVRFYLPDELAQEFQGRYDELSAKDRTYCYDRECQAFIAVPGGQDVATCPKCGKTTCVSCKAQSHGGDCEEDTALQQLRAVAEEQQWQRCYQCSRFLELTYGCYHMTCPCGGQFCYVCGARWKTCECAQWDEARLRARAVEIENRNPGYRLLQLPRVDNAQQSAGRQRLGAGLANRRRDDLIARTMEHLRINHECSHNQWRYISGEHRCEECNHVLREYIFECRQCKIMACNRCRRNRL